MDAVCTKRGKNEMDYVTHLKPDGTYQPLREHEENVAALAGEFAAAFGAQEHGHRTGLLHDIGKYSANGQKRQRDPAHTAKVDHASAGAQLAARLGDYYAACAVAGHHGGLPDWGDDSNDGGGTLCARLNKCLTGGNDPSAWKTEIEIPAKVRFPAWLAAEKDARRGENAGTPAGKAERARRAVAGSARQRPLRQVERDSGALPARRGGRAGAVHADRADGRRQDALFAGVRAVACGKARDEARDIRDSVYEHHRAECRRFRQGAGRGKRAGASQSG